jgi:NitT/TauT family transport system permease protein
MKTLVRSLPLLVLLLAWEWATATNPRRAFFFGSPSGVLSELRRSFMEEDLIFDIATTGAEAISGFIIGNVVGATAGLALWHLPFLFRILRPYILALGSAPLFALAPIIIIWFGTGFFAKTVIASLSTVFVALMQAYKGAEQVDVRLIELVRSFGGDRLQVFRKVIVPASLAWVTAAFRLNIGLALLGAFLGEYISSERGLGHLILVAGGLYNIPLVLVGVLCIIGLGWVLSWAVNACEKPLQRTLVKSL